MDAPKLHVGIVGCGLGGLAAAIGIARAGHTVTVLEQAHEIGEIGAGIQIPPNSSRILGQWGLLDEIKAVSVSPTSLNLRSYRGGNLLYTQGMSPAMESRYGRPYLTIHRADFHRILVAEARRLGVSIVLGSRVEDIDFEVPLLRVQDMPDVEVDLIIGADGLKSFCREALVGHPDPPHLTGDLAYRLVIKVEDMKQDPQLKELVEKPAIDVWMGPHGHVVGYFLQQGALYNIVAVCPDNLPVMINTLKADLQEMRELFKKWDPKIRSLLEMVQDTTKWRLMTGSELTTWCHPSGNFAILGDACHATLPYLAQGAAQAVEDGAVLGGLFECIESPAQIPDILRIYECLRKHRTSCVTRASTAQRKLLHLPDGDRQQERDRQLTGEEPCHFFPYALADPRLQPALYHYDAYKEAHAAWDAYKQPLDAIRKWSLALA